MISTWWEKKRRKMLEVMLKKTSRPAEPIPVALAGVCIYKNGFQYGFMVTCFGEVILFWDGEVLDGNVVIGE